MDRERELVRTGAFADSLAVRLPKVKDHHGVTIGQVTKALEDEHGLCVEGRIYPTRAGQDLALLMKAVPTEHGPLAPVDQGSVGMLLAEAGYQRLPSGVGEITRATLYEVSPVTFAANDATRVALAKGVLPDLWDGPWDELATAAARTLRYAVSEGEALAARRKAAGRQLNEKSTIALGELLGAAEAAGARLGALMPPATGGDAEAGESGAPDASPVDTGGTEPRPPEAAEADPAREWAAIELLLGRHGLAGA